MRTIPRTACSSMARIQAVSRHRLRLPSDRDPVGGNGAALIRDALGEPGRDELAHKVAPSQEWILGSKCIQVQERLQAFAGQVRLPSHTVKVCDIFICDSPLGSVVNRNVEAAASGVRRPGSLPCRLASARLPAFSCPAA
jgi:hypothetical protein